MAQSRVIARAGVGWVTGALLLLLSGAVLAQGAPAEQPARALVQRGVKAFREADFAKALDLFRQALTRSDLGRAEQVEAQRHIALCHGAYGHAEEATRALRQLLRLDPLATLPAGSPPALVEQLETLRRTQPRLEHLPGRDVERGPPVKLVARVAQLPAQTRPRLYYRPTAAEPFRQLEMPASGQPGSFAATLPPFERPTEIEYYLIIEDPSGQALASVGEPARPLRLAVEGTAAVAVRPGAGSEPRPWYRRWYFWAGIGALVVAGALGGGIGAAQGGGRPDASLGYRGFFGARP
jgi:hypothetical protein